MATEVRLTEAIAGTLDSTLNQGRDQRIAELENALKYARQYLQRCANDHDQNTVVHVNNVLKLIDRVTA